MQARQGMLTVMVQVQPGRLDALRALLTRIEQETRQVEDLLEHIETDPDAVCSARALDVIVPFARLRSVHFARFTILERGDGRENPAIRPYLVFATDFDGAIENHIEELARLAGKGLASIFGHCLGFPRVHEARWERPAWAYLRERLTRQGILRECTTRLRRVFSYARQTALGNGTDAGSGSEETRLVTFLRSHMVPYCASYVGTRGRSVEQIRGDARLVERIRRFVSKPPKDVKLDGLDDVAFREAIREVVSKEGILTWLDGPPDPPQRISDVFATTRLIAAVLAGVLTPLLAFWILKLLFGFPIMALALSAYLVCILINIILTPSWVGLGWLAAPWFLLLRAKEERDALTDAVVDVEPSAEHRGLLEAREDLHTQNPMTILSDIKPGPFRLTLLVIVLWTVDLRARQMFYKGRLRGLETIHFARWLLVPGQRRLLFLSSYDFSWQAYLSDFVTHAAPGITAIWSNVVGFPPTRDLISEGAAAPIPFLRSVRRDQILTDVWYSAYPGLPVQAINNNSRIREGLFGPPTAEGARRWRRLLPGMVTT